MLALQQVLGLTGTKEGVASLSSQPALLTALSALLSDSNTPLASDGALALINLSTSPSCCSSLLEIKPPLVPSLVKILQDRQSCLADQVTMLLSNLTRDRATCSLVQDQLAGADIHVSSLLDLLCEEGYNKVGAKLHYLGPVLSNLSQLEGVRTLLLDRQSNLVQRLLPFTEYQPSVVRRGGVVGTLRNCCFATTHHEWLMGDEVDLVTRLLLPLAGPTPDDLPLSEVESLPLDLQYLDEEKKVEQDADIRTMLLEGLTQLCATRQGREVMRGQNVYIVLRQFHGQEQDRGVRLAAENIIDILIKNEDEIKVDNYKEVEVPQEMVSKFKDIDDQYMAD